MTRHDDLRETARDRLYAVAGRPADAGPVQPTRGRASGTGAHGADRAEPADSAVPADPLAWLTDPRPAASPPPGTRRPRHRDTAAHPKEPAVPDDRGVGDDSDDDDSTAAVHTSPDGTDTRDVVTRMRAEALASAASVYTDRYGHPLDHGRDDVAPPRVRWGLTVRHGLVAGVAVAVLTTGVALRAASAVPDDPAPPAAAVAAVAPAMAAQEQVGAVGEGPAGPSGGVEPPAVAAAGGPGTAAPGAPQGVPDVVVHVVGQVASPGVVHLPAGSRVQDALVAVGGAAPSADLSAVNLARVVQDGEQIVVPAPGEAVPAPPAPGGGTAAGTGPDRTGAPVDLNSADLAALDALPGIGPVLAQRIVDWRADNGPFRAVEELGEVSGIGDALLGRLRSLVRV